MCGCNNSSVPVPVPADPSFPPVPLMVPAGLALDLTIPAAAIVATGGGVSGVDGLANPFNAEGRVCTSRPGVVDPWTGNASVNWKCCTPPVGRFKVQGCVQFVRPAL